MGKTGTTTWAQVKGVRGQIRLVPANKGKAKKPGPNQKFKRYALLAKASAQQRDDRRGQRGGRGGRGRRGESNADIRVRKHIKRSVKSAMGIKTK